MNTLTCPYTNFTRFYIIIWNLKQWRLYICILYVLCYIFEGLYIHLKFTILKSA